MTTTRTRLPLAVLAALATAAAATAQVTWTGGNFTWDQPDTDSFDATYSSGSNVTFGNTGIGTITLGGILTPGNVSFTNTTGTYILGGGTLGGAGSLSKSGAGTLQIGSTTALTYSGDTTISAGTLRIDWNGANNTSRNIGGGVVRLEGGTLRLGGDAPSGSQIVYNVSNNFAVSAAGGTIDLTRVANNPVWNLTGSLSLNGSLTLTSGGGGSSTGSSLFSNGIVVGNNASIVSTYGANSDLQLGAISGSADKILTISGTGSRGLLLASSNSFAGTIRVIGTSSGTASHTSVIFNSAPSSNGLNIETADNGVISIGYAVSGVGDLSNITARRGGGIRAYGTSGTLNNLGQNVVDYVGEGGSLILDNTTQLNNNRLSDSAGLALENNRLFIAGRNLASTLTEETIGALSFSGGSRLTLDPTNTNSAGVKLTASSLSTPAKGDSLSIDTNGNSHEWGTTASQSMLTITGTKPDVENGMVSPAIQIWQGASNTTGDFATFSGNNLIRADGNYTNYDANTWAAAASTTIVNLTAATTLTNGSPVSIHALRVQTGNQDLGGRTVNIASGGIIMTSATISNGTLGFGDVTAVVGAYNSGSQATISAAVSGNAGLTILGNSQTLNFTGTNSALGGGIFINGGAARFTTASANGNNVTVNAFGRLVVGTSAGGVTDVIGGLSGSGTVSSWVANAGTAASTLDIRPASGSHTFQGVIQNAPGQARPVNIIKSGAGTQSFGANSVGTYTGTTTVTAGTLLINGNFSAATGNVTVSGGTLGGSGIIGGATTIQAGGTLAPGNSPGILTFTNGLTMDGTYAWELAALSTSGAGVNFDQISLTGGNGVFNNTSFSMSFGTNLAPHLSSDSFWNIDQSWVIVNNTGSGSVSGTFAPINNSTWDHKGAFSISLGSGSGGDVVLHWTAIPEPSAFAALAGLGALGFAASRRRRLT
jgi:autotransporter-associated beta strand protein